MITRKVKINLKDIQQSPDYNINIIKKKKKKKMELIRFMLRCLFLFLEYF